MKPKRRYTVRALFLISTTLLLLTVLSGCNKLAELHISGETMELEPEKEFDYKAYYERLSQIAVPETEPIPENTTVYWVENGEVWHINKDCTSLSRSKKINSGNLSAAIEAGKTRACSRCLK